MESQFEAAGGTKAGGGADTFIRHASDTWQMWAFFFTAFVVMLFAIVDALAVPLLSCLRGRLVIVGVKIVVFVGVFGVVVVNRVSRRWLAGMFERYIRTER
jgi:hypothetical protein